MVANSTRPSYALQLILLPPWELKIKMAKIKKRLVCKSQYDSRGFSNLHLALGGVLGAGDIKSIEVNMVAFNRLDNEHLQWGINTG